MAIKFIVICILLVMLLPAGNAFAVDILRIGSTGHTIGSMKLLSEDFEKAHPDIKIQILPLESQSDSMKAVTKGELEIAFFSRPLENHELTPAVSIIAYAKTPVIFISNKEVTASDVTTPEIIKTYRCETNTWPEGKRRRLMLRPPTHPDSIFIKKTFPETKNYDRTLCHQSRHATTTDQEHLYVIEKVPGSLGISTLTMVLSKKSDVKILSLDGIPPVADNRPNPSYPLYMTLYMLTKKGPSASVSKFIEFVRSEDGRKIIEASGNLVISDSDK